MGRTKLIPKSVAKIRQWPPKEPYTKFKIKTLLPEQKTIDIKKNGQVIRTLTVRRKTKKFTYRWARDFLKNACTKLVRSRYRNKSNRELLCRQATY